MQEQVDEKTVAISIKASKITGRLLAKAMQAMLKRMREPSQKTGKQSLKSLSKQGATLTDVEISGDNIGSFNKIARKYSISYALKKDSSETPPKWYVFFKAKDVDVLTAAMNEYGRNMLQVNDRKPSIHDSLAKAQEIISQKAPPVRNRNVGGHEL